MGKLTINGPFSIAMLNYQRVILKWMIWRNPHFSKSPWMVLWCAFETLEIRLEFERWQGLFEKQKSILKSYLSSDADASSLGNSHSAKPAGFYIPLHRDTREAWPAAGCWHPSSTDSWNDVSHTKTCTVKLDHQLEHLKCLMFHVFFWLATRFDYLIIFGWSGGVPNTVREQHHVLVCLGEFCRLKSPIEWSIYPLVI